MLYSEVSVIILMGDKFWEESTTEAFRRQELSDPVYFGDPSLILGTGWEGGSHIRAEQSMLYLWFSLLIIARAFARLGSWTSSPWLCPLRLAASFSDA